MYNHDASTRNVMKLKKLQRVQKCNFEIYVVKANMLLIIAINTTTKFLK